MIYKLPWGSQYHRKRNYAYKGRSKWKPNKHQILLSVTSNCCIFVIKERSYIISSRLFDYNFGTNIKQFNFLLSAGTTLPINLSVLPFYELSFVQIMPLLQSGHCTFDRTQPLLGDPIMLLWIIASCYNVIKHTRFKVNKIPINKKFSFITNTYEHSIGRLSYLLKVSFKSIWFCLLITFLPLPCEWVERRM